ncbi:MAG: Glu/Leu/Phe/Val dehydrogenase dimerization domain-containing protein [Parachlamydiaceae bacterium]
MLRIKELDIPGYEKVIEGEDPTRGLHCFIAIHSTVLGPALGGARIYPYATREAALEDALRLAKAMTYKSSVAEDGLGGGKSVIIADPKSAKTPELLHAFAEVIDHLKGSYITAEDVGTTIADMMLIREKTPYVAALSTDRSSGDPSRFTARGIYRGIQAVTKKLWHTKSLKGKKVAIQGLGNVGSKLANILFWEGAELIVSDIDEKLVHQHMHDYGAQRIDVDHFNSVECDILAPCALGGTINPTTIPLLRCKAIAGSANNQLLSHEQGQQLMELGILYAPDYIINSGGIINAAAEFEDGGYNPRVARDKVNHLYDILIGIFHKSEAGKLPTNVVADHIAEHNLRYGIGKRKTKIIF